MTVDYCVWECGSARELVRSWRIRANVFCDLRALAYLSHKDPERHPILVDRSAVDVDLVSRTDGFLDFRTQKLEAKRQACSRFLVFRTCSVLFYFFDL